MLTLNLKKLFGLNTVVAEDTVAPVVETNYITPKHIGIDVYSYDADMGIFDFLFTETYAEYEVAYAAYEALRSINSFRLYWHETYEVYTVTVWNSKKRMYEITLHLSAENANKRIDGLESKGLECTWEAVHISYDEIQRLYEDHLEWKEGK